MKIKSIEYIRDYGVFQDYSRGDTKDFKRENIIFGWNYSGKTTLSRIFRSLEQGKPHPDYGAGRFKIILCNGETINEGQIANHSLEIRVFNSDFVQKNFNWAELEHGHPPILLLGETKGGMQKELNRLVGEKKKLTEEIKVTKEQREKEDQALQKQLTAEAKRVRTELELVEQYDKRDLNRLVDNKNIESWRLSEAEFRKQQQIARSSSKLGSIPKLVLDLDETIVVNLNSLLEYTVTPSKIIERLKVDQQIEDWARRGKDLHRGKTICLFCGRPLLEGFLNELDSHFSQEYEAFRGKVEGFIRSLKGGGISRKMTLPSKNDFYPEFQDAYEQMYGKLQGELEKYDNGLTHLIVLAEEKLDKLGSSLPPGDPLILNVEAVKCAIQDLNGLIAQNEQKTNDFDRLRREAKMLLKRHYAAQFYADHQIGEVKRKIHKAQEQLDLLAREEQTFEGRIQELEGQLLETQAGADRINYFIKLYFGHDTPLKIQVEKERFFLYRGELHSKNLSEGEKTAISFAYFLTCLQDKYTETTLDRTIVFIDDPVSSLDENHIYNTYVLIENYISKKCAQLFISTHNSMFFSLLKHSAHRKKINECDFPNRHNVSCGVHLFQAFRNGNTSKLGNLDCLLCKFSTEYQYVFYRICRIITNEDDLGDEYNLYLAPNLLRRFLEVYLGFNYPSKSLRKSLEVLITNRDERVFVHKVINELSHNENVSRSFRFTVASEIKEALAVVFWAFKKSKLAAGPIDELLKSIGSRHNLESLAELLKGYKPKLKKPVREEPPVQEKQETGQLTLFP